MPATAAADSFFHARVAKQMNAAARHATVLAPLTTLLDNGSSMLGAARALGIPYSTANFIAARYGLKAAPGAAKAAVDASRETQLCRYRAQAAVILGQLEEMRPRGLSLYAAAAELGVVSDRVYRIWKNAHGATAYKLPPPPKPAPAERSALGARRVASVMGSAGGGRHNRNLTADELAAKANAIAHTRRVADLPEVTAAEADRLVAEYLARKPATICPTMFAAPVNNGEGL